jgi:hypothetical protein
MERAFIDTRRRSWLPHGHVLTCQSSRTPFTRSPLALGGLTLSTLREIDCQRSPRQNPCGDRLTHQGPPSQGEIMPKPRPCPWVCLRRQRTNGITLTRCHRHLLAAGEWSSPMTTTSARNRDGDRRGTCRGFLPFLCRGCVSTPAVVGNAVPAGTFPAGSSATFVREVVRERQIGRRSLWSLAGVGR